MTDTPQPKRRPLLAWSGALAVGVLGIWLLHRHQFASSFDLFPGPRGDTRLIAYLCEHWYQALHGKSELLSPPMFYPAKTTLAYSDLLLLFIPPYALLRGAGADIFTALAITVVVFNFLNFVAGFALLFHAARFRMLPSVAGAMFFAFNNPKLSNPDLLQLQPVWLLAIAAMCVVVFVRDASFLVPKRAFGLLASAGLAVDLQLLTGFYLGWFVIFWFGLFLALTAPFRQTRDALATALRRHWQPVLAAAGLTVAGLIPFLFVYLPAVREVGGWPYSYALREMPEPRSYLLMADGNFVWSGVTEAILQASDNAPDWGRRIGIGLVATVTWLGLSLFAIRSRRQGPFVAAAILAVNLLILLALQFHGHSLWHKVYEFVPGATAIRDVARFMIVAALPISIAFAFAAERAQRRIGKRTGQYAVLLGLIAFGVFEQFNSGDGQYYSIRAENERLQRLARKLPADCAAFYVTGIPVADPLLTSSLHRQWMHDAMLVSILRGVPTLNGRSGKSPPGWALREVTAPDYVTKVRQWITRHNLSGTICRLEMDVVTGGGPGR
jgi:hypothetical protein